MGEPFQPLRTLAEAKAQVDGYVILQGDDGGQIYVIAPANGVQCSPEALEQLLRDLDCIAWPGNDEGMRRIYFERLAPGACVAGGMGGGVAGSEPWVHTMFGSIRSAILQVLSGKRGAIK